MGWATKVFPPDQLDAETTREARAIAYDRARQVGGVQDDGQPRLRDYGV